MLTPEFLETHRQNGASDELIDRTYLGSGDKNYEKLRSKFTAKYGSTNTGALLDFYAYGTTQPEVRALQDIPEAVGGEGIGGFIGETVSNIIPSAGRFIGDVASAVVNPVETAKALGQTALGGVVNLAETIAGTEDVIDLASEDVASQVGDFFKERYGSLEQAAETIKTDPVGFLADIAGVFSLGAGGLKVAGLSGAAARAGKIATTVDPITGAAKLAAEAGKTVAKPLKGASQKLFQSALKPTKSVLDKFPDVVQTGIKEGIIITKGSIDDISEIMDNIDADISTKIDDAGKAGVALDTEAIISRLDEVKKFFRESVGGSKLIGDLDELAETFRKEQGKTIEAGKAQTLKRNTQKLLRKQFGELKAAEVEGKKALTRGIKEELVNRIPELEGLNKRQQSLIGLSNALERFAGRTANKDLFGLTGGVGIGAGGVSGGVSGAIKGGFIAKAVKTLLDSPAIKSELAIVLDRLAKGKSIPKKLADRIRAASQTLRFGSIATE